MIRHLGHAPGAPWAEWVGEFEDDGFDRSRDVSDARGSGTADSRGLVIVPVADLEVLAERVAVGLHDAALDLADDERRVDGPADVMGRHDPVDHDVAGLDVDASTRLPGPRSRR